MTCQQHKAYFTMVLLIATWFIPSTTFSDDSCNRLMSCWPQDNYHIQAPKRRFNGACWGPEFGAGGEITIKTSSPSKTHSSAYYPLGSCPESEKVICGTVGGQVYGCNDGQLTYDVACPDGSHPAKLKEGQSISLICPSSINRDKNSCGNTAADPFDTLSGAQVDSFDDIAGSNKSLAVRRTLTSFNDPAKGLTSRPAYPEIIPWSSPFGNGWFWEYGIFVISNAVKNGADLTLIDKDGLFKVFHRLSSDTSWRSHEGDGEIQYIGDKLHVFRSNGEELVFTYARVANSYYSHNLIHVWRLESIIRPDSNFKANLWYENASAVDVTSITSNTGTALDIVWSGERADYSLSSPRFPYYMPFSNRIITRISLKRNGVDVHHVDYTVDGFNRGSGYLTFLQVKTVSVDGRLKWKYSNQRIDSPFFYVQTNSFSLVRSTGKEDTTSFYWGTPRGSSMIAADNKLYSDTRFSWTQQGDSIQTRIETATDRSGTKKVQLQTFDKIWYEMDQAFQLSPVSIDGPGCSICGVTSSEKYSYSPYHGKMSSKCDSDGILYRYSYDSWGNNSTTSPLLGDPSCPTPEYIIADAVTAETNQIRGNPLKAGAPLSSDRPSVLMPWPITSFTLSDYIDPNTGLLSPRIQKQTIIGASRKIGGFIDVESHETRYSYSYDAEGNVVQLVVDGPRSDSFDVVRTIYYPGTSNIATVDRYVDSVNFLRTQYVEYDASGNPKKIIDPTGLTTEYQYNEFNKVSVQTQKAAGSQGEDITTQYFYDGAGDIDYIILPEGNVVDYEYVGKELLIGIQRKNSLDGPVIDSIAYEYDPEGNRTAERHYLGDASGTLTSSYIMQYDIYNHVAQVINGLGKTKKTKYSPSGLLLLATDEGNHETSYWYDSLKRLYEVRSPDGGLTRYGYDTNNNLTKVFTCKTLDCNEAVESLYFYDDFGRLVSAQSPDSGIIEYEYDESGNLKTKLDARGQLTQYEYDASNRLLSIRYDGSPLFTKFYYDGYQGSANAQGRLAAAETESGITVYGYDMAGRTTSETRTSPFSLGAQQFMQTNETRWTFDKNGNILAVGYPTGVTVFYDRDASDFDRVTKIRLETKEGIQVLADAIAYDPGNLIRAIHLGNGLSSSWERDTASHIVRMRLGQSSVSGSLPIVSREYTYYDDSNIASIDNLKTAGLEQSFNFDQVHRLVDAAGEFGVLGYSYDKAGNRIATQKNATGEKLYYNSNSNQLLAKLDASIDAQPPASSTSLATISVSATTARTTAVAPQPSSPTKTAAITRILNDFFDLFFSGRRFMNKALGGGTFSNGKSALQHEDDANAMALFTRKATDTTLLLKESLQSGLVTQKEIKLAAADDSRLQSEIDQFFDDIGTLSEDQSLPFLMGLTSILTQEDLQLLSAILDLAGRVTVPPTLAIANPTGKSNLVLALTNQPAQADVLWQSILNDVRILTGLPPRMGAAGVTTLSMAIASVGPQNDPGQPWVDLKNKLAQLKSLGVKPSSIMREALLQPGMDDLLLQVVRSKAPLLGLEPDAFGTTTVAQLSVFPYPGQYYLSDAAGNLAVWFEENEVTGTRQIAYDYEADNRLHGVSTEANPSYSYDHLGRRVFGYHNAMLTNLGRTGTEPQFWTYDAQGNLLSWQHIESVDGRFGVNHSENYVYLYGERIAKLVLEKSFGDVTNIGGGGGGCCCASTAIAYDGQIQCDLSSFHALQVLRGFRNTVLSGTTVGEWVINVYYHGFSPVAVPVLREYPELRHGLNFVLRGVAWGMEFWVQPASAMSVAVGVSIDKADVYWYHNDHLGTPLALSDKDGVVVAEWKRDPFGMVVSKTGSVDDNNMFPGQFWDADAGLAYNWNRWYSPEIGRYVSPDGYVEKLLSARACEAGRQINRQKAMRRLAKGTPYSYGDSNPIRYGDFNGLLPYESDCWDQMRAMEREVSARAGKTCMAWLISTSGDCDCPYCTVKTNVYEIICPTAGFPGDNREDTTMTWTLNCQCENK